MTARKSKPPVERQLSFLKLALEKRNGSHDGTSETDAKERLL
jgi:hypothetical protein